MGSPEIIKTLAEFIEWTQEVGGRYVLYRGLASDANGYKLSASLHRRMVREGKPIQPPQFARAAQELVEQARMEGHDRDIGEQATDLEILAKLQHYGAATCLIDFTKNPLVALWFACQPSPNNGNGKIVAINTADQDKYRKIETGDIKESIKELMNDEKLWKWEPTKRNNRIVAQQSVFIFGTPEITDDNITSSCVISNKEKILAELGIQGISAESLFCDFDGFAREISGHGSPYRGWTAEDYFDFGVHYQQLGELKKAIDSYDQAIEINPKDASAYNNRGIAKAQSDDFHNAIADFNQAIEINPKDEGAYHNRGIAKDQSGDFHNAIADFNQAIKINPKYANAYHSRGIAKAQSGDLHDAIADFNQAIKINPKYEDAYYNRGNSKDNLGEYRDAIADFNEAIKINPKNAFAYNNRGKSKDNLGEYRDAITDYNEAIKINPKYTFAYNNRGIAKDNLGEHRDAIADYNEIIKINPKDASAYYNRGIAKLHIGDKEGAMKDFQEAHKIDPDMKIPDIE